MLKNRSDVPTITIHRSLFKALKMFNSERFRWLDDAAAAGPLTRLKLGPVAAYIVSDPAVARRMLVADANLWRRPPAAVIPIRLPIGDNLFTQSEKAWSMFQPEVAPQFRKRAMESRLADMPSIVDEEVRAIPYDTAIDLELTMGRIALVLAAWVLLGERLDSVRAEELALHQREVVTWVGHRMSRLRGLVPFAPRSREMKAHANELKAYAADVLKRRAALGATAGGNDAVEHDVLDALMHAKPGGRALDADTLNGHLLGLLLAGNETTAAALSWALVQGSRTPELWDDLTNNIREHTNAFIDETMRLSPAVWGFARTPKKRAAISVGDVSVQLRWGEIATIYLRGINHDPTVWPEPLVFRPARQLQRTKEQERASIGFGLGHRGCIGQHMAIAEMQLVLPKLAQHGRIEITQAVEEDPSFALRARGGMFGTFRRRS